MNRNEQPFALTPEWSPRAPVFLLPFLRCSSQHQTFRAIGRRNRLPFFVSPFVRNLYLPIRATFPPNSRQLRSKFIIVFINIHIPTLEVLSNHPPELCLEIDETFIV